MAKFKSIAVLPYKRGHSETVRRNLQQQGIRTVFKSDTTLRSWLVRPKDPADPNKQDGVIYKIPCECRKVYIGEMGRPMQESIKEHDWDIRLPQTQNSAVSEHSNETGHKPLWKEVKFIDRNNHWYTRKVKESIHIRLNPNNINRHNGTEIPEAWKPTIKKHQKPAIASGCLKKQPNQRCTTSQRTPEENVQHRNNSQIEMRQSRHTTTIHNAVPEPVDPIAWRRLAVSSRNVAFYIKVTFRETKGKEKTYAIIQLPWRTTNHFITLTLHLGSQP